MDQQLRHGVSGLTKAALPTTPGVYALYREGGRMYVGKATSLRTRVGAQHCAKGASMTNSALRRNICQHLGIAAAADIKARRYNTTLDDAGHVSDWLAGCEFAWIECASAAGALELEQAMRQEFKPLLNRL